jgi:hypothetical protein
VRIASDGCGGAEEQSPAPLRERPRRAHSGGPGGVGCSQVRAYHGGLLAQLSGRPAFWSSVFFLLLLAWVPLLAEWGATGEVKSSSLQTFVALYGLGLGASSRNEVSFGVGVVVALIFSISYGSILAMENAT